MRGLLSELSRRRVFRVALAYAAGAFVVVQAAQIYFPALGLPDWAFRTVAVLSLVGLPVALVLAWIFDITPTGVRRTPALNEAAPIAGDDVAAPLAAANLVRRIAAVGAVGVLALAGVASLALRGVSDSTLDRGRVLVLPFENHAGDAALQPVGRMAAEWLTQGLASTGIVEVVPAMTVLASARAAGGEGLAHARERGRELGAGTVVWGSYYSSGGRLTFSAHISDVASGRLLGALEPVSAPADDPAAGLAELRERVMGGLGTILNPRLAGWGGAAAKPWSWAAYQEYADGMERYVVSDFPAAASRFDRAFRMDTTLLLAALWYANSQANGLDMAAADSTAAWLEDRREQLSAYERAFLERLRARMRFDWAAAHRAAVRMTELAPGSDEAMREAALDALRLGRAQEAVERLRSLDPDRGWLRGWREYWFFLASAYHLLGRHDDELNTVREGRARDADPKFPWYLLEANALAGLGRVDDLLASVEEAIVRDRHRIAPAAILANAAAALLAHGHADAASQLFARAAREPLTRIDAPSPLEPRGVEALQLGAALMHADALLFAGDISAAEAAYRHVIAALAAPPTSRELIAHLDALAALAYAAARRGDRAAADAMISAMQATQHRQLRWRVPYARSRVEVAFGDHDLGLRLFREALAAGLRHVNNPLQHQIIMDHDPALHPLRSHPAFGELVRPAGATAR